MVLRRLEQNRFETALLYGKRLAIIADTDKYGGVINVLKNATGEDPLSLEIKHKQQSGSFIFEGLVLMASNEALKTSDHSSGLERRRVTVRFDRVVSRAEKAAWAQRGGEEAVLHSEMPGLINWLLDLSEEEIGRIIHHPPKAVEKANFEALKDENPMAEWVTENCVPADAWTQIGIKEEVTELGETRFKYENERLYPNYLKWCKENNRMPVSTCVFRRNLMDTLKNVLKVEVYEKREAQGQGVRGIRLRRLNEPLHEWMRGLCRATLQPMQG